MEKIKVLIVEDSAFMRKLITSFIEEDHRIEVLGIARNGKDAIDKIKVWKPDVVTMDIEMPILNGLEALQIIMKECPVPVIMLSSSTKQGAENTFFAMQKGAFDFVAKPSGTISLDLHKIKEELIEKIVAAGKTDIKLLQKSTLINKATLLNNTIYSKMEPTKKNMEYKNESLSPVQALKKSKKIVAIGTSTGGPRALQSVLTNIPGTFGLPILIVQHMPAGFTKSLANRLDHLCEISVKEAEDGEIIQNGTAYIAPGGFHLKVLRSGNQLAIHLDHSDVRNGHRPSVDVMFESISKLSDYSTIAVIMTGLGNDGSKGLIALKSKQKVVSIAESEASSIVFGMPKAAIATNLVDVVEDVENIAHAINKYC